MISAPMATSWKYGFTWSMFSALEMIPVRSTVLPALLHGEETKVWVIKPIAGRRR